MAAGRPRVDRSAPPPPREIHPFRFPHFLRTRLPNGLKVVAARLAGLPLVSMELIAPAGAQYESEGSAGTATLTAGLLDEGTAHRSALEIAAVAERLGGYLLTGADWDVGYLSTGLLSSHRREGLDLLADVAAAPAFPPARSNGCAACGSRRSCAGARTRGRSPTTGSSARSFAAPSTPSRSTAPRRASPGSTANR